MWRDESQSERRQRERAEERAEEKFHQARNAHASYGAALRRYAKQIAHIVRHHAVGGMVPPEHMPRLIEALRRYREGTKPWAAATAWRMLLEVARRNRAAWQLHSQEMSWALRRELLTEPSGEIMQRLLGEQVDLITSLPWEMARRVQETSQEALETGARYPERTEEIEEMLARAHPRATERWLANRATLIARTETARSASVLVQARSEEIGAEQYIWRTAGDFKVRPSHRRLNRTVHNWDNPPLSDPPDYHSHPGQIFNCRCVALPIISDG